MKSEIKEFETDADVGKLSEVTDFLDALLEQNGCPFKTQTHIDLSLEELFVNIAHYAYPEGGGKVKILADVTPGYAEITFIDSGIPYDPLAKSDPDITLDAEERQIGGLGIFMVKQLMDEISYKYDDNKNILKIKKNY